jgi:DNA polymerase III delta prime subunit
MATLKNITKEWNDTFIQSKNILGNKKVLIEINSWVKNLETNNKPLFLIGSSGIGKTEIAKKVLEENGYYIHYFNALDFANKVHIQNSLKKIIYSRDISIMTTNYKRASIIIDEIEGINSYSKKHLLSVINTVKDNKQKKIPIICIGTGSYFKNLNELIKQCICVQIGKPNKTLLQKKAKEIIENNNIKLNKTSIKYITTISQNDFRRLGNIIRFLSYIDMKPSDLDDNIESLCQIILQKNQKETELFDFTRILLSQKTSFGDSLYFFCQEKVLLPLMIHQNYLQYLNHRKGIDTRNWIPIIKNISEIISYSDLIGNYIYNNHYWDLSDCYSYLSCYYPSLLLNKYKLKSKKNLPEIKFTSILSRNSIQRVRKNQYDNVLRNIKNVDNCFDEKLMVYISRNILFYLLHAEKKKNKHGINKLKYYHINIKSIPSLIKLANLDKFTSIYSRKRYLNLIKLAQEMKLVEEKLVEEKLAKEKKNKEIVEI